MTKKLLIDASHAEETRVVVLDGNRLEDFDVETATRKQIKGNIYLAKVIRVEPSLQAAFVEYGGNRHGFLAFGEIHPDYYQIPVADRQRLLKQQADDEAAEDAREAEATHSTAQPLDARPIEIVSAPPPPAEPGEDAEVQEETSPNKDLAVNESDEPAQTQREYSEAAAPQANHLEAGPEIDDDAAAAPAESAQGLQEGEASAAVAGLTFMDTDSAVEAVLESASEEDGQSGDGELVETASSNEEEPAPESLGGDGDDAAEARERRQRQRFIRNYKIQDVIHRRQIMLIQVVKEERGNKGAALTTYLSLAGRFSVLMPNSPSGGGVSRKITSVADRRRLKEAMAELDVPEGMGLIVRTAGANRPKPEITRDCEYLLRLWDDIRERTMESTAPALIYEEASLIKRTIRDVYTRDVEELLVDGEEGFNAAREFMAMLMPAHTRKIKLWTEGQPLFARYQVEAQLDAMLNPVVQLRSGGYIVINQTEALVAIDVNSGRATRERSIEDTALRTNMEAAEEVARQLRMRDLAGLIVIDFIDMEVRRNNASVERRLKDSLANDRARIQVGNISHFGLMEMSRQRLRPSVSEASLVLCPHCAGLGHVRSAESAALHILRAIEDEGAKFHAAEVVVHLPQDVALYLFNHKRDRLAAIEARYRMKVVFAADAAMLASNFRIEKMKAQTAVPPLAAPASYAGSMTPERVTEQTVERTAEPAAEAGAEDEEDSEGVESAPPGESAEDGERRRRRRRRRGKRRPEGDSAVREAAPVGSASPDAPPAEGEPASEFDLALQSELGAAEQPDSGGGDEAAGRRRRNRGGRRRRSGQEGSPAPEHAGFEPAPFAPIYGDIADIFEAAERAEAAHAESRTAPAEDAGFSPISDSAAAEETLPPLETADAEPESLPPPARPGGPTVIGQDTEQGAPEPEKKRGWWRR